MLTRGHGRRRGQLITNFHHYRVEIFCQVLFLKIFFFVKDISLSINVIMVANLNARLLI